MESEYHNPANDFHLQHIGSEALAFKNTRVRRYLALLALHTTAKLFKWDGPCRPLSRHKILKTGFSVHLTEAVTMNYVARHTSIPVPKVYCSFLHKNRAYIVMERVKGEDLAHAWRKLSKESLEKIFAQLKDMIQELRTLKPPQDIAVGSCAGGSLFDSRLPNGSPRFGPFKTFDEFHRWLREDIDVTKVGGHVTDSEVEDLKAMVKKQDVQWPPPVFTHCDLNPSNILVRGDKIVSIIDWEFSGWYPVYWEYTSAWRGNILREKWQATLFSLLDPYPEELEMEKTRCKWWGEW
ncbi:kinase-like protein [Pseudovirgaria hyperparasitica]|uniref:Kinase-like protein n=1 Tax=Pseudovirgaria hyperparasitica TaxID=470096 RepID=A0A6A6W0R5_9PEZI|nr:kinase-like protein [Pseudovirgaria hyperparasitica]KAF2756105.1 kinase-like protein [Pseudovirgaria hyperparasitica]